MRVDELAAFIRERHAIWKRRQASEAKPWTQDPILQRYRFCNVYRELDTVTIWLRETWRDPYAEHPNLWFAMAVARAINWPDTLKEIGFPSRWNWEKARDKMRARAARGEKVYTGAYMLRSDAMDKPTYTCLHILQRLWEAKLVPRAGSTLAEYHARLADMPGWGSFLAAQVVCDLKYTRYLSSAPDWMTWAASGPGSRRGLNRVCGMAVDEPWSEPSWLYALTEIRGPVNRKLGSDFMPLHAQDMQNCLCEFDKYERVRLGEGKPRYSYPGV